MFAITVSRSYGWEWLKWLAFAAMVSDHVSVFFLGGEFNALRQFGLIAFPIFCLTVGFGLARTLEPLHVALRLVFPAFLAQVAWVAFVGVDHLNVLGVFALCAGVVALLEQRQVVGVVAFVGLLALSPWLEGGPFGPLLVAAGYLFAWRGLRWPAVVAGGAFALITPVPVITLAAALVPLLPQPAIPLPRVRGLLMWGYPAHLFALGFARAFV